MNRVMKGSMIILSLLVIGSVISVQGAISAKAAKAEFSARQDFTWPHPFHKINWGERFVDEKGNEHIRNRIWTAPFWYTIDDGAETAVRVYMVYNSITDETDTGPKHGQMIIFTGDVNDVPTDETILWEGSWHGSDVEDVYSGKFQLQGRGGEGRR